MSEGRCKMYPGQSDSKPCGNTGSILNYQLSIGMNAACWSASDFLINNSMRQPIKTHRVSRDTKTQNFLAVSAKSFLSPCPGEGWGVWGEGWSPFLWRRGWGWWKFCRSPCITAVPLWDSKLLVRLLGANEKMNKYKLKIFNSIFLKKWNSNGQLLSRSSRSSPQSLPLSSAPSPSSPVLLTGFD